MNTSTFLFCRRKIKIFLLLLFYAVTLSGQNWNILSKYYPVWSNGTSSGSSVAITKNLAATLAPWANAAFIFQKDSTNNWPMIQRIAGGSNAGLCNQMILYQDYLVSGCSHDDVGIYTDAGTVSVFKLDLISNRWRRVQLIKPPIPTGWLMFGETVGMNQNYLFIGTRSDDYDEYGRDYKNDAGAVYVYKKVNDTTWTFFQKLVARDRGSTDYFGHTLSVSDENLVVGAANEDEDARNKNYISDAGSVYVFTLDSSGFWSEDQKLNANIRGNSDHFGTTVGIQKNYLIIGSPYDDEDSEDSNYKLSSGSIYVFHKDKCGFWEQIQKITSPERDTNEEFGRSFSISKNHIVAGSEYENALFKNSGVYKTNENAGAIYIYSLKNNRQWTYSQKLTNQPRRRYIFFGNSLGIYEGNLIAGTPADSTFGSTFIYQNDCTNTFSAISVSSCNFFESPSGNHYWTESGTYTDTITNSSGCDSIISVKLIIKKGNTKSIDIFECDSFVSPSGKYVWKKSGSYIDYIKGVDSCNEIVFVNLQVGSKVYTQNINTCAAYTSPNGKYMYSKTGTYYDTFHSVKKCDSIIKTNLIINYKQYTIKRNACNEFLAPSGNHMWYKSGIYNDTLKAKDGCDSILIIHLNLGYVDTGITLQGKKLTASETNAVYTWLDCNFKATIVGENNKSYTVKSSGIYAVIINKNSCLDTSKCVTVNLSGISELRALNESNLALDLFSRRLKILLKNPNFQTLEIAIFDILGNDIYRRKFETREEYFKAEIDLRNERSGVYLLECISGQNVYRRKIVLE